MKFSDLSRKEKKNLIRILAALMLFTAVFAADKAVGLDTVFAGAYGWLLPFACYLAVYLLIGYDVLLRAVRNIFRGRVFDENFLMCTATLGAFALAVSRGAAGQPIVGFDEACAVLLFYQVGEFFQSYATGKSRRSISTLMDITLMDIRPDYANLKRGEGIEKVDPADVKIGEIIVVNPGEKIPLDGTIVKGAAVLDTKALTGESLPREALCGTSVISGSVNLSSQIEIKVEKLFYDSTVSKILELVENASGRKSKAENFITKFARWYTPAVVAAALLLAVIPGFLTGMWSVWVYRALSFLVVSCPCALVISVPLSFFAGIGAASRYGILVKGSNYLEQFNKSKIFVFDKTGTLTKGTFSVVKISPAERADEILRLAAAAEGGSSHPIAVSIAARYGKPIEEGFVPTVEPGEGVAAFRGGETVYCGNEKLMRRHGISFIPENGIGTVVYVAKNGEFIGSLLIADEIKPESKTVVGELNAMGCRTVMLTGDNEAIAAAVSQEIGVSGYKASLLPQNKVEEVEKLMKEKKSGETLCFIGDGINDAPVLMRSDIGIAMGGVGSDANITFSIAVKLAILILSAFGLAGMGFAVFGDVGVAVIAILNAMRVNTKYKIS